MILRALFLINSNIHRRLVSVVTTLDRAALDSGHLDWNSLQEREGLQYGQIYSDNCVMSRKTVDSETRGACC
jgi:hypothetical protein